MSKNPGWLHKYFLENADREINKHTHYLSIYEKHFARFVDTSPTILEIGVGGGGALQMWKAYFGPGTKCIGVDISQECWYREEDIDIFVGSQDDPQVIKQITDKYPHIDIIIDDGSHQNQHMINTFAMLYPHLHKNGVYLIEDCHTCYREEYGGGFRNENSFIEFSKQRVDDVNALHTRGACGVSDFTKWTQSISFYESIVVYEKMPQGNRHALHTQALNQTQID